MLIAEANIPTDQASRYLAQLCRHAGKMGQHLGGDHRSLSGYAAHAPPQVLHADCSDTTGAIRFSDGQCVLQATEGTLLLRVEAVTENALHRLQNGITHRLETFGYREHPTVRWQPSISGPTVRLDEVPAPMVAPVALTTVQRRWRLGRNLALAAAAAFAIVAHLGVLGATLATATWAQGAPAPSSR
jgi:hypothetical protein